MASRPVFIPDLNGPQLVRERFFDFKWAPGFAEVQKKKNVVALHAAARDAGMDHILEISTKSEEKVGQRLSAFFLKIKIDGEMYPLESVYQGAKVFRDGGPYPEIFSFQPRNAKKFIRELDCGRLKGFQLQGALFPLSPKTAFYDWLYIRALADHAGWITQNVDYAGYSDIEFNPEKQVNCQARAFASFKALVAQSKLENAVESFDYFASLLPVV